MHGESAADDRLGAALGFVVSLTVILGGSAAMRLRKSTNERLRIVEGALVEVQEKSAKMDEYAHGRLVCLENRCRPPVRRLS